MQPSLIGRGGMEPKLPHHPGYAELSLVGFKVTLSGVLSV